MKVLFLFETEEPISDKAFAILNTGDKLISTEGITKSLPEKLPLESGSIMNTFKESTKYKHIGWNACINEILGDTE